MPTSGEQLQREKFEAAKMEVQKLHRALQDSIDDAEAFRAIFLDLVGEDLNEKFGFFMVGFGSKLESHVRRSETHPQIFKSKRNRELMLSAVKAYVGLSFEDAQKMASTAVPGKALETSESEPDGPAGGKTTKEKEPKDPEQEKKELLQKIKAEWSSVSSDIGFAVTIDQEKEWTLEDLKMLEGQAQIMSDIYSSELGTLVKAEPKNKPVIYLHRASHEAGVYNLTSGGNIEFTVSEGWQDRFKEIAMKYAKWAREIRRKIEDEYKTTHFVKLHRAEEWTAQDLGSVEDQTAMIERLSNQIFGGTTVKRALPLKKSNVKLHIHPSTSTVRTEIKSKNVHFSLADSNLNETELSAIFRKYRDDARAEAGMDPYTEEEEKVEPLEEKRRRIETSYRDNFGGVTIRDIEQWTDEDLSRIDGQSPHARYAYDTVRSSVGVFSSAPKVKIDLFPPSSSETSGLIKEGDKYIIKLVVSGDDWVLGELNVYLEQYKDAVSGGTEAKVVPSAPKAEKGDVVDVDKLKPGTYELVDGAGETKKLSSSEKIRGAIEKLQAKYPILDFAFAGSDVAWGGFDFERFESEKVAQHILEVLAVKMDAVPDSHQIEKVYIYPPQVSLPAAAMISAGKTITMKMGDGWEGRFDDSVDAYLVSIIDEIAPLTEQEVESRKAAMVAEYPKLRFGDSQVGFEESEFRMIARPEVARALARIFEELDEYVEAVVIRPTAESNKAQILMTGSGKANVMIPSTKNWQQAALEMSANLAALTGHESVRRRRAMVAAFPIVDTGAPSARARADQAPEAAPISPPTVAEDLTSTLDETPEAPATPPISPPSAEAAPEVEKPLTEKEREQMIMDIFWPICPLLNDNLETLTDKQFSAFVTKENAQKMKDIFREVQKKMGAIFIYADTTHTVNFFPDTFLGEFDVQLQLSTWEADAKRLAEEIKVAELPKVVKPVRAPAAKPTSSTPRPESASWLDAGFLGSSVETGAASSEMAPSDAPDSSSARPEITPAIEAEKELTNEERDALLDQMTTWYPKIGFNRELVHDKDRKYYISDQDLQNVFTEENAKKIKDAVSPVENFVDRIAIDSSESLVSPIGDTIYLNVKTWEEDLPGLVAEVAGIADAEAKASEAPVPPPPPEASSLPLPSFAPPPEAPPSSELVPPPPEAEKELTKEQRNALLDQMEVWYPKINFSRSNVNNKPDEGYVSDQDLIAFATEENATKIQKLVSEVEDHLREIKFDSRDSGLDSSGSVLFLNIKTWEEDLPRLVAQVAGTAEAEARASEAPVPPPPPEAPSAPEAKSVEEVRDPLFEEAVTIVRENKNPSISYLQRRLKIGYQRSARIIEQMEKAGIISRPDDKGRRQIFDEGEKAKVDLAVSEKKPEKLFDISTVYDKLSFRPAHLNRDIHNRTTLEDPVEEDVRKDFATKENAQKIKEAFAEVDEYIGYILIVNSTEGTSFKTKQREADKWNVFLNINSWQEDLSSLVEKIKEEIAKIATVSPPVAEAPAPPEAPSAPDPDTQLEETDFGSLLEDSYHDLTPPPEESSPDIDLDFDLVDSLSVDETPPPSLRPEAPPSPSRLPTPEAEPSEDSLTTEQRYLLMGQLQVWYPKISFYGREANTPGDANYITDQELTAFATEENARKLQEIFAESEDSILKIFIISSQITSDSSVFFGQAHIYLNIDTWEADARAIAADIEAEVGSMHVLNPLDIPPERVEFEGELTKRQREDLKVRMVGWNNKVRFETAMRGDADISDLELVNLCTEENAERLNRIFSGIIDRIDFIQFDTGRFTYFGGTSSRNNKVYLVADENWFERAQELAAQIRRKAGFLQIPTGETGHDRNKREKRESYFNKMEVGTASVEMIQKANFWTDEALETFCTDQNLTAITDFEAARVGDDRMADLLEGISVIAPDDDWADESRLDVNFDEHRPYKIILKAGDDISAKLTEYQSHIARLETEEVQPRMERVRRIFEMHDTDSNISFFDTNSRGWAFSQIEQFQQALRSGEVESIIQEVLGDDRRLFEGQMSVFPTGQIADASIYDGGYMSISFSLGSEEGWQDNLRSSLQELKDQLNSDRNRVGVKAARRKLARTMRQEAKADAKKTTAKFPEEIGRGGEVVEVDQTSKEMKAYRESQKAYAAVIEQINSLRFGGVRLRRERKELQELLDLVGETRYAMSAHLLAPRLLEFDRKVEEIIARLEGVSREDIYGVGPQALRKKTVRGRMGQVLAAERVPKTTKQIREEAAQRTTLEPKPTIGQTMAEAAKAAAAATAAATERGLERAGDAAADKFERDLRETKRRQKRRKQEWPEKARDAKEWTGEKAVASWKGLTSFLSREKKKAEEESGDSGAEVPTPVESTEESTSFADRLARLRARMQERGPVVLPPAGEGEDEERAAAIRARLQALRGRTEQRDPFAVALEDGYEEAEGDQAEEEDDVDERAAIRARLEALRRRSAETGPEEMDDAGVEPEEVVDAEDEDAPQERGGLFGDIAKSYRRATAREEVEISDSPLPTEPDESESKKKGPSTEKERKDRRNMVIAGTAGLTALAGGVITYLVLKSRAREKEKREAQRRLEEQIRRQQEEKEKREAERERDLRAVWDTREKAIAQIMVAHGEAVIEKGDQFAISDAKALMHKIKQAAIRDAMYYAWEPIHLVNYLNNLIDNKSLPPPSWLNDLNINEIVYFNDMDNFTEFVVTKHGANSVKVNHQGKVHFFYHQNHEFNPTLEGGIVGRLIAEKGQEPREFKPVFVRIHSETKEPYLSFKQD